MPTRQRMRTAHGTFHATRRLTTLRGATLSPPRYDGTSRLRAPTLHAAVAAATLLAAALPGVAAAAAKPAPKPAHSAAKNPPGYTEQIRDWRARRVKNLTSDTGWLTVAGLFWLHDGDNTFGTEAGNDIVLPAGSAPARAGVFAHAGSTTTVHALPGTSLLWHDRPIETLQMRSDVEDTTDVVSLNSLRFFVIKRSDRWGIRMRDLQSSMRKEFHGIDSYPIDAQWRTVARFEPYTPPHKLPIATIIGTIDSMVSPGALIFDLQGKTYRLDPVLESPSDTSLFIIFKDDTSGEGTYGAGRFLYADMPKDGKTVVDFNKAYNPPCAFTAFATCPLPPLQNELPLAIHAGEKRYGEH